MLTVTGVFEGWALKFTRQINANHCLYGTTVYNSDLQYSLHNGGHMIAKKESSHQHVYVKSFSNIKIPIVTVSSVRIAAFQHTEFEMGFCRCESLHSILYAHKTHIASWAGHSRLFL